MIAGIWPHWNATEAGGWITAIATIGALIAAGLAWRVSHNTYTRDTERYEIKDAQEQAARFSGWVGEVVEQRGAAFTYTNPTLLLRNASDAPVYGVFVRYYRGQQFIDDQGIGIVPPSAQPVRGRPAVGRARLVSRSAVATFRATSGPKRDARLRSPSDETAD